MELQKTFAEVNLKALSHNLDLVREKTRNTKILGVVKADAYGHGIERVSRHLISNGVSMLGVAYTHEAIALRNSGIDVPVLIFFDRDNADACIDHDLIPIISDLRSAKKLSREARKAGVIARVHIKVDTGMGRVGLELKKAVGVIKKIVSIENIRTEGLMSHFADADLQDKSFARLQLKKFRDLIRLLKKDGIRFRYTHIANSAAVMTMPDAHFNLVRPGIMLYGYSCCEREKLKPVMTVKSRIILIKKVSAGTPISYARTFVTKRRSTIATIPVGYADGYSRKLSNNGEILIRGKRAPVVGRVCMDTIMADITEIPNVDYDTEVVILGKQGRDCITADEIADKTGTISYEVLATTGKRIRRVYR